MRAHETHCLCVGAWVCPQPDAPHAGKRARSVSNGAQPPLVQPSSKRQRSSNGIAPTDTLAPSLKCDSPTCKAHAPRPCLCGSRHCRGFLPRTPISVADRTSSGCGGCGCDTAGKHSSSKKITKMLCGRQRNLCRGERPSDDQFSGNSASASSLTSIGICDDTFLWQIRRAGWQPRSRSVGTMLT